MTNPSMSINNSYNSNIIRDPFGKPSSILNIGGNCLSITTLQLLMASPSLMFLFYEHNYCSTLTCFQLQLHIAKNKEGKCNLIKDIEYSYLVHEVMVMMGFRTSEKERKGHSCMNHPTSTGSQIHKDYIFHPDTVNGSLVLHNFYHLCTMRKNGMINKKEIQQSALNTPELLSTIDTKSVREKFLNYTDNKIKNFKFDDDELDIEMKLMNFISTIAQTIGYLKGGISVAAGKYRYSNFINVMPKCALLTFIDFLFIGNGAVHQNETVAHTFYKTGPFEDEVKELIHKTLSPQQAIDLNMNHVTYFPHLQMVYLKIIQEIDYNQTNGTINGYPFAWHQSWNDDICNLAGEWLSDRTAQLFVKYGFPSTVIIDSKKIKYRDLFSIIKPSAVKISVYSLSSLINLVSTWVKEDNDTSEEVDMTYVNVHSTFPEGFWCDDIPCKRKLFTNDVFGVQNEEFEAFAFILEVFTVEYRISVNLKTIMIPNRFYEEYKLNRSRILFDYLIELSEMKDVLHKLDKTDTAQVLSKFQKDIEIMVYCETVYNLGIMENSGRASLPFSVPSSTLTEVKHVDKSHSISLVRTFDKNWWLINNEDVQKMENPRKTFDLPQVKRIMDCWVTGWQRVGISHSILEKLRTVIHPITENDLSHS
ncbi:hypothetical protein SNEBB_001571 [Seison nebaliae]|nr:hypothetical protein SNEBB_001571 [Seison nebaliae]